MIHYERRVRSRAFADAPMTMPRMAFYNLQGQWDVENYGTPPDVEVDLDPKLWRQGKDSQLEKAVEVVLAELKKNLPPKYKKPAYPNYYGAPKAGSGSTKNERLVEIIAMKE
ncbi:MAG: hypothetical protein HY231_26375 [Acidobacteria bacterium]|nr:hypothetical protein [Acidobacteriota bacterium]